MKKASLIFIIIAFFLSGCGALKEVYRIDKVKQENCNPCGEKTK